MLKDAIALYRLKIQELFDSRNQFIPSQLKFLKNQSVDAGVNKSLQMTFFI